MEQLLKFQQVEVGKMDCFRESIRILSLPPGMQLKKLAEIVGKPVNEFVMSDAVDELVVDFEEDLVGFRSQPNATEKIKGAPAILLCLNFLVSYFPRNKALLTVYGLVHSTEWRVVRELASLAGEELDRMADSID